MFTDIIPLLLYRHTAVVGVVTKEMPLDLVMVVGLAGALGRVVMEALKLLSGEVRMTGEVRYLA